MDNQLKNNLEGTSSTEHILPFFWQHGESHEELEMEIEAIYRSNLREFCVESRTHEDFMKEKWWIDFGFILREAQKRDMKVWLLDDKRFPTGFANGYIKEHPELRKKLITAEWRDFPGPKKGARLIIPYMNLSDSDYKLLSVVAYRRTKKGNCFAGEPIDLTGNVENGIVQFDIPEGTWRVYYIFRTTKLNTHYVDWIDMIDPDSCEAMIKSVYEPTYEHFKEYFGNTFKGFFSDEPCFGNDWDAYDSKLGKPLIPIPWREDLPKLIANCMREEGYDAFSEKDVLQLLPALFHTYSERKGAMIRIQYMNVITRLYRDCFTKQISEWCHAHSVSYMGHIIEDMGTHMRMGYGPGHYFRSLEYQDMAGMDIVLQQIVPGLLDVDHPGVAVKLCNDPDFFNYFQGKLPRSLADVIPAMQGRAICEIYGAFGWAEGIPMMKMLTDHMISNGINYYVPHAFSPKYPDYDCPPHFYARGMNPQFEAFSYLMEYLKRCTELISNGINQAPVAMLYMAEADWSGGNYVPMETIGKELIRHQIDYTLLWEDILPKVEIEENKLRINEKEYRVLVVPMSEYQSEAIKKELNRIYKAGVPVIYISENEHDYVVEGLNVISVERLAEYLQEHGLIDIRCEQEVPLVRYYHISRDEEIYFFASEDIFHESRFSVILPDERTYRVYDPWMNRIYTPRQKGNKVELYLPKGGAVFLVSDSSDALPYNYHEESGRLADLQLSVSVLESGSEKEKGRISADDKFMPLSARVGENITGLCGMERFAGTIRYEGTIWLKGSERELVLNEVGEIAHIVINGIDLGWSIASPYSVELSGMVHPGKNDIRIDVVNNLGYRERDRYSTHLALPLSGLIGPVMIY